MTVEENLVSVLQPVCPRVFPGFAATSTQRPYITFQQIGGEAPSFIDAQVPDLKNGEFQINVWSGTHKQAVELMLEIEAALVASGLFQARPVAAHACDYDADIPVYSAKQDFTIWSAR